MDIENTTEKVELHRALTRVLADRVLRDCAGDLELLRDYIENSEPVKYGKWDRYVCSECNVCADYFISGGDFYFDEKPNFCPNCGAKMN